MLISLQDNKSFIASIFPLEAAEHNADEWKINENFILKLKWKHH